MIATILVAAVAIGVAVVIGAIAAPRYLPYFPRKRGRTSGPATDEAAICVTTDTRWCWCREDDLPEEDIPLQRRIDGDVIRSTIHTLPSEGTFSGREKAGPPSIFRLLPNRSVAVPFVFQRG
jgi:hypothetical protein